MVVSTTKVASLRLGTGATREVWVLRTKERYLRSPVGYGVSCENMPLFHVFSFENTTNRKKRIFYLTSTEHSKETDLPPRSQERRVILQKEKGYQKQKNNEINVHLKRKS